MSAPAFGAARRVVVHVDAEYPVVPSVTVLPGTSDVAVRLAENTRLDTSAVTSLLEQVSAALRPAAAPVPGPAETEVRVPIEVPGSAAVLFQARAVGASVQVRLGREAVRMPPRQAILLLSRMAALAIRAGTATLTPLHPTSTVAGEATSAAGAR